MMKSGLLSLCLCSLGTQIRDVYALPKPSNATVVSETYSSGEGGYVFTDVNGLDDVISDTTFEIVIAGLGFGEGPKWIQDCDYVYNGYMLIGDQYSDCIWKYWATGRRQYSLECIRELSGEQPNGIGWNLNYPDEIFVACQAGNALYRLNLTADGLPVLNYWNESTEGYKLWFVNDVVEDSQGNAYFTTYPWNGGADNTIVTGAWQVPRSTMEPELIEEFNYGQNGIAMTLDEKLLVYANTMDYPAGTFAGSDSSQINYTNLYWRGYNNSGSMSSSNSFTASDGYYYAWMSDLDDEYWNAVSVSDGSAFDFDGNYWQAVITQHGGVAGGWVLITDADDPTSVIGVINFTDAGYGPTNVAKGMDGYMYITLTQWSGDCSTYRYGWGCGGILGRVPLVNYYTADGSNDYVLNCTADDFPETTTTTTTTTTTMTPDSDSAYRTNNVNINLLLLFACFVVFGLMWI